MTDQTQVPGQQGAEVDAVESAQVSIPLPTTAEEDVEAKLTRIEEMVRLARTMPLSSSVLVAREELLAMIAEIRESLPKELRQARWMLREKDEFVAKARRESDLILDDAHAEAARMVSETEVARDAEWKAGMIVEEAENRARNLRAETDGYIDSKLASFEATLKRTLEAIVAGRERLRAVPDIDLEYAPQTGWPGDPRQSGSAEQLHSVDSPSPEPVADPNAQPGGANVPIFDQDHFS